MISLTDHGPRLHETKSADNQWHTDYGVGSIMQVSPTEIMVVAHRRILDEGVVDFADGGDAFVVENLDQLKTKDPVPLVRSTILKDENIVMAEHAVVGGFIPAGALLESGKPHPAAGTGFVLTTALSYPADFSKKGPPDGTARKFHRVIQLEYQPGTVRVKGHKIYDNEPFWQNFKIECHAISNAIADGEDLIGGLVASPGDPSQGCIPCNHPKAIPECGRNIGSGLCRWQYNGDEWFPASYTPVTGADMAFEPSVIRDHDGALLMAVRGIGSNAAPGEVCDGLENTYEHLRVYRSADNGESWQEIIHLPRKRTATPVVINQTLSGQPFLAGSPYPQREFDKLGNKIICTCRREELSFWPLTKDRCSVGDEIRIITAREKWGNGRILEFADGQETVKKELLYSMDHPVGSIVRLGDEKWHSLVAFRVSDNSLYSKEIIPSSYAGLWVEEVHDDCGATIEPSWQFSY